MREMELNVEQQRLFDTNLALVLFTYLNYYISKAIKYNIDQEDLMQCGYMGLVKAVKTFDSTLGYKFSTYAVLCIRHTMSAAIKSVRRRHNDSNISIYTPISNQKGECITLADEIPSNSLPLDDLVIARETLARLKQLRPRPLAIIKMYTDGYSYDYIGKQMNLTRERVRQIIFSVRKFLQTDEQDLSRRKNTIYYT